MSSASVVFLSLTLAWSTTLAFGDDLSEGRHEPNAEGKTILEILNSFENETNIDEEENKKLAFEWRDCGGSQAALTLNSFSLSPFPLRLPGKIVVGFNSTARSNIDPPISLDMKILKKVGFWVDICALVPHICHRPNICSSIRSTGTADSAQVEEGSEEPLEQRNFCKIAKGPLNFPMTSFAAAFKAPSGWYRITANFKQQGKTLACLYLQLKVA